MQKADFAFAVISSIEAMSVFGTIVFNRPHVASFAILGLACFTFAYSSVLVGYNPDYWFQNAPPRFVSRIITGAIAVILAISIYRSFSKLIIPRHIKPLIAIGLLMPATPLLSDVLGLRTATAVTTNTIFAFSLFQSAMFMTAATLATTERENSQSQLSDRWIIAGCFIICVIVTAAGYIEVVTDTGYVRNMYIPGVVETRGSSFFNNPNWFAVGLVPFFLLAMLLGLRGFAKTSVAMCSVTTIGFIASASRSVTSILVASYICFILMMWWCEKSERAAAFRTTRLMIAGTTAGVMAAGAIAVALGDIAWQRFLAVLLRLVTWPLNLSAQGSIFKSFAGRMSFDGLFSKATDLVGQGIVDTDLVGQGIVDSAYIFLAAANPVALILTLAAFAFMLVHTAKLWAATKSAENAVQIMMLIFVVLCGFAGQVYWAFPVWPILALLISQAIMPDAPASADRRVQTRES